MVQLYFQIIDINSDDLPIGENYWDKQFIVTFYGKTQKGENIVCNVQGYKPFFYLRVPDNWSNSTVRSFLKKFVKNFSQSWNTTRNSWKGTYEEDLMDVKPSYNFYGYNYNFECNKIKNYRFAKISFQSYGEMKKCISALQSFYKENQKYIPNDKTI